MKIEVDNEFHDLIPPLRPDEYQGLKQSIEEEGCRDALVVWNGLILDGHNRYKICKELNISYKTKEIELPDREVAKAWIERNQLNRRNLTPDQISLLRGRFYNRTKKQYGGDRKSSGQNGHLIRVDGFTADKLAKEFGVSEHTVRRNGKIAEYLSNKPEEEKKVLQGEKKLTEVKKDRQKMETNKKAVKETKNGNKGTKQESKYYLTGQRLTALRKKVKYIFGLLDVKANCLAPVSTIRNEVKNIMNELNKLEPYRK